MPDARYNRFNRGDFLERYGRMSRPSLLRPATWNGFVADVANALSSLAITSFAGGSVSVSPGGTALGVSPGTGGIAAAHAYTVFDASSGGTPMVGVTPGTHNGVVPTISGSPMNVKIGTPLAYPVLTLGGSDTLVYFQIDYDTGGNILTIEIKSGGPLPTATIVSGAAGSDYKLLSTVAITYATGSGKASVQCNNDAVSGPQGYAQCGAASNVWLV